MIEEGKKSTQKVKDPLSFEIWIFRNDQPEFYDYREIAAGMIK